MSVKTARTSFRSSRMQIALSASVASTTAKPACSNISTAAIRIMASSSTTRITILFFMQPMPLARRVPKNRNGGALPTQRARGTFGYVEVPIPFIMPYRCMRKTPVRRAIFTLACQFIHFFGGGQFRSEGDAPCSVTYTFRGRSTNMKDLWSVLNSPVPERSVA